MGMNAAVLVDLKAKTANWKSLQPLRHRLLHRQLAQRQLEQQLIQLNRFLPENVS